MDTMHPKPPTNGPKTLSALCNGLWVSNAPALGVLNESKTFDFLKLNVLPGLGEDERQDWVHSFNKDRSACAGRIELGDAAQVSRRLTRSGCNV